MYVFLLLIACAVELFFFMVQRTSLEYCRSIRANSSMAQAILPHWYRYQSIAMLVKWVLAIVVSVKLGFVYGIVPIAASFAIMAVVPIPYEYFMSFLNTANNNSNFTDKAAAALTRNSLSNQENVAFKSRNIGNATDQPAVFVATENKVFAHTQDPAVMFKNGLTYFNGEGVPKDELKGIQWFIKAAELGNGPAQFVLGQEYELGIVVEKDMPQALMWAILASKQGHQSAAKFELKLTQHMTKEEISEAHRRVRLLKYTDDD